MEAMASAVAFSGTIISTLVERLRILMACWTSVSDINLPMVMGMGEVGKWGYGEKVR